MAAFEERFKTKAQTPTVDVGMLRLKQAPSKVCLMEPNRAKNLAITLRKEVMAVSEICAAIETYVHFIFWTSCGWIPGFVSQMFEPVAAGTT